MNAEEAPASLAVTLVSRREQVDVAAHAVEALLREHGATDAMRWRIELAVREAVANAIVHGNRERPGARVRVELAVHGGELVVRVEDEGAGFDPARVADPRDPSRRLLPGGRGVLLMREIAGELRCEPREGGGAVVTLRVRWADSGGPASFAQERGSS